MRKMRPNFQFKPRLVASGEYDNVNHRYVLDNKLELNKVYLLIINNDDNSQLTNLILSTINFYEYAENLTASYGVDNSNIISFLNTERSYLNENATASGYYSTGGFTIYVYELFGVSGV